MLPFFDATNPKEITLAEITTKYQKTPGLW